MERLVIKEGSVFLLTNVSGEIVKDSLAGYGLYMNDTQFLNLYRIFFQGKELELVFSSASKNLMSEIITGNPEIRQEEKVLMPRLSVLVRRTQWVEGGMLRERIHLQNFNPFQVKATLTIVYGSEFRDIFEIRGDVREKRGKLLPPKIGDNEVKLGYAGLDGITRYTVIRFSPNPSLLTAEQVRFDIQLEPKEETAIEVTVLPQVFGPSPMIKEPSGEALLPSYSEWFADTTSVQTDNPHFNEWIRRGLLDLRMLLTDFGQGPVPAAGIPWFSTLFGRDSIIASLQLLMFNPRIARNTLFTLAARQGNEVNEFRDEEPGKIIHEMRQGEMAILKEIPFGLYYGSVDSTPLFVILYVEYYRWTKDMQTARLLLPAVLKALSWMERFGDADRDGYLEFGKKEGPGLKVQSWKDSDHSMVHTNGQLADPPLAVCEVQGYAYYAKIGLSRMFAAWGNLRDAQKLAYEASMLKTKFNQDFWMENKKFYALALEEDGTQVKTITSDPGHCLWAEIIDPSKARWMVPHFIGEGLFSGWGVRTMSAMERPYDPFSYHNGSVWPHDNSLIILGLKKYGYGDAANLIIEGLFTAATRVDTKKFPVSTTLEYERLPELFSGYPKGDYDTPVLIPASSPQAWAAGSALLAVQAILGLFPDPDQPILHICPTLPPWINQIEVKNMRLHQGTIGFSLYRQGNRVVPGYVHTTGGVSLMWK